MAKKKAAIELDSSAGMHISRVCEQAAEMAQAEKKPVHFVFNDTHVTAQPGESAEALQARWSHDREVAAEAWRNSLERKVQEAEHAETVRKARLAVMVETAQTEKEMREAKVPWPLTEKQMVDYIGSLLNRSHDYGTCVYAMSMAAEAAFNYVAGQLGVTGFQASCADLDVIRRTRNIDGPFMLIKGGDALYPQYDLKAKLAEAMESWRPWLKEQAEKKLAEAGTVHPEIRDHWKKLAKSA